MIEKLGVALVGIFVLTSIQRFWVHPSGGHTHRQSDTIGMSLAFSEELRTRGLSALDFLIYPRILQRGLLDGINASEFPLLNVVGGPFFLGSDPFLGVFFTSLLILLLNLWVGYSFLPKLLRAWQVEVSKLLCLLIWFSAGTVASQSNVVMPEGVAFPLVIMGMVYLLDPSRRLSQMVGGSILCGVGIAVKPTVVIALGILVALPIFVSAYRRQWKYLALVTLLCLVFPAWWYGVHAKNILALAQGPQIFARAHFNPLAKLSEIGPNGLVSLLIREPHQGQLPMFVGWIFIVIAVVVGEWVPVALYLGSIVAAAALDGAHIFDHGYYFIGTCVFSSVVMARAVAASQDRTYLRRLLLLLLFWGVLFNIRGNIWVWARHSQYWRVDWWAMGEKARQVVPKDFHLITDDGAYPQKLLFLGRSGKAAGSGVYSACNESAYQTLNLAIVSDSPSPDGANLCGGRTQEQKVVETPYAKWYVSLIHADIKN